MKCITLAIAMLLAAPVWANELGEVTFAINEYSCPDAPSLVAECPGDPEAPNPRDTGQISGSVRVVMEDGITFSVIYSKRVKVGMALLMQHAPSCHLLSKRTGGALMYESTLVGEGFTTMIEGMNFGAYLSEAISKHYGRDDPWRLPTLSEVSDKNPVGIVDGQGQQIATERTVRFRILWTEGCQPEGMSEIPPGPTP
jgi:hypothetical protein